ncbi:MAG: hypothetical protein KUG82_09190 [Pseudomonadales bacterium]|nr:hypothetical protein [Pseudomonadales bacterium]
MINYELTDQLIELENIQRDQFLSRARGRQASEIINHYHLSPNYYSLTKESDNARQTGKGRRTIVLFNFGEIKNEDKEKVIECLFFLGHSPDFISEAMGLDLKFVAQSLIDVIEESRAQRASDLRANPQRFRLVGDEESEGEDNIDP